MQGQYGDPAYWFLDVALELCESYGKKENIIGATVTTKEEMIAFFASRSVGINLFIIDYISAQQSRWSNICEFFNTMPPVLSASVADFNIDYMRWSGPGLRRTLCQLPRRRGIHSWAILQSVQPTTSTEHIRSDLNIAGTVSCSHIFPVWMAWQGLKKLFRQPRWKCSTNLGDLEYGDTTIQPLS